MRVRFYCDSGANIHSCREEVVDVEKDLGYTAEEWKSMSGEEKDEEAKQWAYDRLYIGYEEITDGSE